MRRLQRFVGIVAQVDLVQLLLANLSGGLWIQLLGCKKQHSYLLQVIPTKNIHSDIYIYICIYILTFHLAFYLAYILALFLARLAGSLDFIRVVLSSSSSWHSMDVFRHSFWHMYLAYLLTLFLAYASAISYAILSGICIWHIS